MQKEHIYRGEVDPGGKITVTVDDEHRLDLFLDVQPESDRVPALFSWGAGMPGGARLAFALLYHATKDHALAENWCGAFCLKKMYALDRNDSWAMTALSIIEWVRDEQNEAIAMKQFQ
ncbi:MAG: hypothetical protein OD918_08320 [Gammaproteobacteria bacterium]